MSKALASGSDVAGADVAGSDDEETLEFLRKVVDLRIRLASETLGHAANYDNVIVLAGYAAFFGLWAGTSSDISSLSRVVTATLIGASLACYVGFHISQMLARQVFEQALWKVLDLEDDPEALLAEWDRVGARGRITSAKVLRAWRPVFWSAVGLGFAGASVLLWNYVMVALNLPMQLTG